MGIERRNNSAGVLRQLFAEQWDYLSGLLERQLAKRQDSRQKALLENGAVDVLVDGTNSRLRLLSGYKNRLRKSVRQLLDYVEQLVAQIPPPLEVSGARFLQDSRVNAFFVNRDSIRDIFSQSHALQAFFAEPLFTGCSHAYAIMFMVKLEKEVLGAAMEGNQLRRDVRKTTVSFTDHKIREPKDTEAQVRQALERFLFESLVEYVNYQLARLRTGTIGGRGPCAEMARSLGDGPPNLKDPEVYMQYLCKALDAHTQLLRLETDTIRINRIGEKVAADSGQVAHDLDLHAIRLGHHGHQVVTLVTYPRDELVHRDELLRRASVALQY
jgi:hypothetical protein